MAFPSTSLLDSFNRSAESPASGWQAVGVSSGIRVTNNRAAAVLGDASNRSYYNNPAAASVTGNVEIYCTHPTRVTNLSSFLLIIGNELGEEFRLKIYRDNSGGDTLTILDEANVQMGSTYTFDYQTDDSFGLRILSTGAVTAWFKSLAGSWTQAISTTHSFTAPLSWFLYVELNDTTVRFDDFGGGTYSNIGSLDKALGALTSTGAGTVAISGSATPTLGALTSAAAGTVPQTGSLAKTLGALTSSGAGAVALTGSLDKTLGALTSMGFGGADTLGSLAKTLGALTASGAGTAEIAGSLAKTLGALTAAGAGTVVEYRLYILADTLALDDTGDQISSIVVPVITATDTLTLTDSLGIPLKEDALTLTDDFTVTVAPIVITDSLTMAETLVTTGPTVPTPSAPAMGGLDNNPVLRLVYGNDRRNPIRTLDLAESAGGHIFLTSGGFSPGAGELTELWSGESIRFDGQQKLAESRKNSTLSINYDLSSGSMAGLSALQREINLFFLEAKLKQVNKQGERVWLEYRWADNLNGLATPTFGQLSGYYEVYAAKSPKWPATLHTNLVAGEIQEVTIELTCSPAPEGLEQLCATAGGAVSLHAKGVLIASGSSSRLYWPAYTNSGLTGNFAVTGWITLNATWASGTKDIFTYYKDASNLIRLQYDRGNTRWVITKIVAGTTYSANSSSDTVASGDDVHFVLVQDDTTLRLYVAGVQVASVVAANTLDDGGAISLGCPATGTIDGIDVILDGWRILPDDPSASQAAAIYTAELPIKQRGGRVGEPPYLLTSAAGGQLGNAADSTHQNWAVIGGVGGDLEAKTRIAIVGATSISERYFWVGIKTVDDQDTYDPLDYLWKEAIPVGTNVSDAGSSEGSYRSQTFNPTFVHLSGLTKAQLFGRYQWLARLKTSASITLTPAWAWRSADSSLNKNPNLTLDNTSFEIVDLGDIHVSTEVEADITTLNLRLYTSTSVTLSTDFHFLLPYPNARIKFPAANILASYTLYIEDGLAYAGSSLQDWFEYKGEPLRVIPGKYNYLFLLQVARSSDDFVLADTATVQVYVTPRNLMPGGMVA